MAAVVLCAAGAITAGAITASACIRYSGEVADRAVPGLPLPLWPHLRLSGNAYGVGGRNTTLRQCLVRDDGARTFGWNWTRGATAPACAVTAAGGACDAPDCYADFSFYAVGSGVSPWGGGTATAALPANTSALRSLVVGLRGLSWRWDDTAPGAAPPQTAALPAYASDSRRARLLLDFFVLSRAPSPGNGSAPRTPGFVTDEVTIDLACNPHFPGSQPPGCLDAHSRFAPDYGPVRRGAVFDASSNSSYDYWYTDHHDAVPGTGSRFSSFRRVGAERGGGAPLPASVDLLPFLAAIRHEWAGDTLPVGAWVGAVNVGTELYDHSSGEVSFSEPPTFTATPIQQ